MSVCVLTLGYGVARQERNNKWFRVVAGREEASRVTSRWMPWYRRIKIDVKHLYARVHSYEPMMFVIALDPGPSYEESIVFWGFLPNTMRRTGRFISPDGTECEERKAHLSLASSQDPNALVLRTTTITHKAN
jgi:hypothetical protein